MDFWGETHGKDLSDPIELFRSPRGPLGQMAVRHLSRQPVKCIQKLAPGNAAGGDNPPVETGQRLEEHKAREIIPIIAEMAMGGAKRE